MIPAALLHKETAGAFLERYGGGLTAAAWDESEHPRDEDGKFTDKDGDVAARWESVRRLMDEENARLKELWQSDGRDNDFYSDPYRVWADDQFGNGGRATLDPDWQQGWTWGEDALATDRTIYEQQPIRDDIAVWRGAYNEQGEPSSRPISTSFDPGVAGSYADRTGRGKTEHLHRVLVPAGSHVGWDPTESEVVLPTGTVLENAGPNLWVAKVPEQMVDEETLRAAGWDESEHPRHPGGTSEGGQFAPRGEDVFQPTVPGTYDEYLDEVGHVDTAWENWTADTAQMYAGKVPARYSMIAGHDVEPKDAELAKARVQDGIAAKLEGDEDFKSLIAALDPYGDWKSEFEPGGSMQTAKTTEQQVAALSIATWARTSGDTDPIALQFQIAAEQEFGLEANPFVHLAFEGYKMDSEQNPPDLVFFNDQQMAGARKFLRAQYELTQDLFKQEGITEVYAYRGMAWRPGEVPAEIETLRASRRGTGIVSVHGNPLSSWSLAFHTADAFTGKHDVKAIAGTKIDVKRILSTPFTGFGCLSEKELVVLGGDDMDAMTWAWNNRYLKSGGVVDTAIDLPGDIVEETVGPRSEEEQFVVEWIERQEGR